MLGAKVIAVVGCELRFVDGIVCKGESSEQGVQK